MTQDFTFDAPGDVMDRILPALQAAKMGGKDNVVFYDNSMEVSREKRM